MKQNKKWANVGRVLTMTSCLAATSWAGITPAMASSTPAAVEQQQGQTVKGVVKDKEGEPVVGASVVEKGTSNGTITDIDGKFSLKLKSAASMLIVSYVGYESKEVAPTGKELKITLLEDSEMLDDVVVIGYGTQKKADVTSAVASIKAEDFSAGRIGDATDLIKGKVAGLSITTSSGNPLEENSIMLRGISTVTGNVSPLVLIDGVEGSLSDIAPENIASIDVLKDASAAAIYGTRGANGVIIISSKTGKRESPLTTTYSTYYSMSNWTKKSDFMDAQDIRDGKTTFADLGADTDWLDEVCNDHGSVMNHSLSLAGGTEKSAYSANISYSKEEGIMRYSGNDNLRVQLDMTHYALKDMVKFNLNAFVREQDYDVNDNAFVYRQAIIRNPTAPVYNADGSYNEDFNKLYYYNPVEMQNEYNGKARVRSYRLTGNLTIEPIKNWQTNLMISRDNSEGVSSTYTSSKHYSLCQLDNYVLYKVVTAAGEVASRQGEAALQDGDVVVYSYNNSHNGSASKSQWTNREDNLELTSRYNFEIGKHRVEALLGYSYLYEVNDGFGASNGNFPTEAYKWNSLGSGSYSDDQERTPGVSSYKNDHTLVGFFGRVSYAFNDRYNLLASFRREGSSRFGENDKWGNFPSVSAGWTINKENFMDDIAVINNLKLRVGFGVTGVEPTENYLAQNLYDYDSYGDVMNTSGSWVKTLYQKQNPNKDLKWETTREINIGLDWAVLENRISGTIDFYNKNTKDMLYSYSVPVPPNLYTETMANVGKMENKGIEVMITGIPVKTKDFTWSTTVTLSHNANKLVSLNNDLYQTNSFVEVGGLGEPISTATHCIEEGHRLGDFWGLKSVGVDKNGFTLVEVKDADGNWTVKPFNTNLNVQENRQRLGNGLPQVYMGWTNTFTYKNFDLSLQFTGQFGYQILNAQRCFYECNSSSYNRLKSANDTYNAVQYNKTTGELEALYDTNGNAITTKLSKTQSQGFWSDHLEDGDFIKLTNVTLGYNVPLKSSIREWVKDIRVYANAQNVFCITGYSGIDPEVSNYYMAPGIDYQDKYPTVRTFTVGLQVKF